MSERTDEAALARQVERIGRAWRGVRLRRHDPLADAIPDDRLARPMERLRELVLNNASALPVRADYLRERCRDGTAR